jgi:hypothetical protein
MSNSANIVVPKLTVVGAWYIVSVVLIGERCLAWSSAPDLFHRRKTRQVATRSLSNSDLQRHFAFVAFFALSSKYLENDIVAVHRVLLLDTATTATATDANNNDNAPSPPRLCVVRPDNTVASLCRHEDDVETDLFADPRCESDTAWRAVTDDHITGTYGEGWYGQQPVPSLGGGPGYGAQADEIWSLDLVTLEQIESDGVSLPMLDVGIAHGEKARGGYLGL